MAKVKYTPGLIPLLNKHFGFVFQPNATNQSMKSDSAGGRTRYTNQTQRQQALMKAIRQWRNMSTETKNNWVTFASTYPQVSKRNPAIFLTGYQLFLKRNHYCFLNHGINCDFMIAPKLEELPTPVFSFSIEQKDNVLDVTELYISNFGIIPQVGEFVLIRVFPMAENSGQFFPPVEQIIEVTESYIDGLFVSFVFPDNTPDVTFSVYLSKKFHSSTNYVGTKVRYMGCFTPKKFTKLIDTPDDYTGQAGKIPVVNAEETGLDFQDIGGGGISCADLINCDLIQTLISQIDANSEIISKEHNTSIPPVKMGLYYNGYCVDPAIIHKIFIPGWSNWDSHAFDIWSFYVKASPDSGGGLKIPGTVFWDSPNTGATNSYSFNAVAAGGRDNHGRFVTALQTYTAWIREQVSSYPAYMLLSTFNTNVNLGAHALVWGHSLRPIKDSTSLNEGESGIYIGNNGRVYRTICIEGVEILADNLAETKYTDGTDIPIVTDNTEWSNLSTPAISAPNNDWSLV